MGVALRTRERAVSETARVAALGDLPRDGGVVEGEGERSELGVSLARVSDGGLDSD